MTTALRDPDFTVRDQGTILVIYPRSPAAHAFRDDHVEVPAYMRLEGGAFAADHRPGRELLAAAQALHGLTIHFLED